MFSLLVKVLVPVASAAAVYMPSKTITPVSAFAGSYSQVSGSCGAESVVISLQGSSLLMTSASGQQLLAISSIDQGRQSIQNGTSESKSDNYGTITNTTTDRSAYETITTTAVLKQNNLTITRQIQDGFSRGKSPAPQICVLQK